jgi:hypothetical protein
MEGEQRQACTWMRWTETDRGRMDRDCRHMEGGQRQACTWKSWTETDRGRMTVLSETYGDWTETDMQKNE